eukprot:m.269126 g.269126  ORF g.269126 m.269126 type:complete len:136 (+) comp82357_c0_seq1:146-553(+)
MKEIWCKPCHIVLGINPNVLEQKYSQDGEPAIYLTHTTSLESYDDGYWGNLLVSNRTLKNACRWNRIRCTHCRADVGLQPTDYTAEVPKEHTTRKGFYLIRSSMIEWKNVPLSPSNLHSRLDHIVRGYSLCIDIP